MRLIFVYNADGDVFSASLDALHKIVSPKTYKCNLCKLTYGSLTMKKEWKEYVDNLQQEVLFLHKDEFLAKYAYEKPEFPAVYLQADSELTILISQKEMDAFKDLNDLKESLSKKL